jgi:hypothetical protein
MAMTEEQIERRVERMVDHLDRLLLSGQMTQGDYDAAMRSLDQWAERKLTVARWS